MIFASHTATSRNLSSIAQVEGPPSCVAASACFTPPQLADASFRQLLHRPTDTARVAALHRDAAVTAAFDLTVFGSCCPRALHHGSLLLCQLPEATCAYITASLPPLPPLFFLSSSTTHTQPPCTARPLLSAWESFLFNFFWP
ncbi:hypothetical protein CCMA1212_000348 [Trichoderma ghanense]|uniref:Uncharacterized protein n=1 Tax=Trichoderma ghanense TaxID=65468 RepID=A0ABY2HI64_9HYPO